MEENRNYADQCGDHGGTNRRGKPCGRAAGWGTDFDSGKCRVHRGTSPDGSSHEGNDNAVGNDGGAPEDNTHHVTHGAYTDQHNLYKQELSERERDLTDRIFDDYMARYRDQHGGDPPYGFEIRLFKISVNVVTEMRVDNWYTDKPDEAGTGTPHIDKQKHVSEGGEVYYRYKKSPATAAVKHLSDYNHRWLKNFNLLPDAESQAADDLGDLSSLIMDEFSGS